jgi:hypothetical protein
MMIRPSTVLRQDLAVLPLGEDLILFSEEAQCILGLNASAAVVLQELQKGTPAADVQRKLSSVAATPEEAEQWVSATLQALASHGMITHGQPSSALSGLTIPEDRWSADRVASMPPYTPFSPIEERDYRLLGTHARIRYSHKGQIRLVDAVIGHLATDETRKPTVVIDLVAGKLEDGYLRSDVYRNEEPVAYASRLSMIGPVVKSVLWQTAINAHDFLFYIHAGVVGTNEGCILLPAQAGSGKSSLTAALTHRGFRYFSDEVALIQRSDFRVPAMPLAICVKSTGWEIMARYFPNIADLPMHWRDDGKRVRYIPPPNPTNWAPTPVTHIIFPRHEEQTRTAIQPISQSQALGRLMAECLALRQRLDHHTVQELVNWIKRIDCYTLTFSSLDEAADAVAEVVGVPVTG